LSETPAFGDEVKKHKIPLVALLRNHPRNFLASTFIVAGQAMLVTVFFLYVVTYMKVVGHFSHTIISHYTILNVLVFSISCGFFGWVSDYWNKKHLLSVSIILLGIFSFLFCHSVISNQYVFGSYLMCSLLSGVYVGVFGAFIASLFSTSVKFSGIALSYNIGFALFGGLSPVVMTYFLHFHHSVYIPAIAMSVAAIIALIGLGLARPLSHSRRIID
jgi:MFS family permease